jgi:outer membrane lipoprotein SlyB
MKIPTWVTPAVYGAGAGAVAMAFIGFTLGGWETGGAARKMANMAAVSAVASSLTPYCVQNSANDSRSVELLAELKEAQGYNRQTLIEKAGWATPLGADNPNRALARECEEALRSSS